MTRGDRSVETEIVEPQYIRFSDEQVPQQKTKKVVIYSVRDGAVLGIIKWYGPWRQFCFQPAPGTTFNPDCLRQIMQRCQEETGLQRAKAKAEREGIQA